MWRKTGFVLALVLCFMAVIASSTMAGGSQLQQIVRPDGVRLALTGTDIVEDGTMPDYGVRLVQITPDFEETVKLGSTPSTIVVIVNDQVAQVLGGANQSMAVPSVPADGYLLVGSGIGSRFLSGFEVRDTVKVINRERLVWDPEPTKVFVEDGASIPISSINKARGTDELVIYTPDFGTHTLTNEWGMEAAIVDGKVAAIRNYQNADLFEIPENGFVISGHGNGRAWIRNQLHIGVAVAFEAITSESVSRAPLTEQERAGYVKFPIVNTAFSHEEVQFSYYPWYTRNEVSFDGYNRPYIRYRTDDLDETGFIHTMRGNRWVELDFTAAVRAAYPTFARFIRGGGWNGAQVVFDAADHLYTIVGIQLTDRGQRNVLLYSTDYGRTFSVYELPAGTPAIEHWVGHNSLTRPPLIGLYTFRAAHPATYAGYYDLYVLQPEKKDGQLIFREPALVTRDSLPPSQHSGGASFAVSSGDKAFITWAEARDPKDAVPGAPTYVATYDLQGDQVVDKQFIAYAPPANDSHNTPGIVIDSKGYLHVITGSHGANFHYAQSLAPNSTGAGWTNPVPVLQTGAKSASGAERGRQTYLAFLADSNDTLHIAFRQWRESVDSYFNGRLYGALSYQQKPVGQSWSSPTLLVVPPTTTYSIFYHKLTQDREGRLFLSYNFRTNVSPYTFDTPVYQYRALIMSGDGGKRWKLATSQDFAAGIRSGGPDAAGEPGRIVTRVIRQDGTPIPGAIMSTGVTQAVADQAGRVTADGIYVNNLTLSVRKDGFRTWTQDVTLPPKSPLEIEAVLTPEAEVRVDWGQLWSTATLRIGVTSANTSDGAQLKFSNEISGVTFDVDPDEGYWGLRFEGRSTQPTPQAVDVRATHRDGVVPKTIQLGSAWQEYEFEVPSTLTRLNMMRTGTPSTIEIRNVRFLKAQ
jgi:hypothetical protein